MLLWGMGLSTSSVHHVAVPSHWTTSPLALTSFPRKVLLEEWRDAEHFPVSHSGDPASPTGDTELVPVVSPPRHCQRAEAVIRNHIMATFGFGPHHTDTGAMGLGSLVIGARFFLETQGTEG